MLYEVITNNIPEYTDAQDLLDDLATEWQKEIEEKFAAIDRITSYNVCYTKLLRHIHSRAIISMWRPFSTD